VSKPELKDGYTRERTDVDTDSITVGELKARVKESDTFGILIETGAEPFLVVFAGGKSVPRALAMLCREGFIDRDRMLAAMGVGTKGMRS